MKAPRETCTACGIALEPREQSRGLCLRCARRELDATKRYFRNGLIIGAILAVLLFLLLGFARARIEAMPLKWRNDNLDAIAALSTAGKVFWAGLAFTVPFGYFHQIQFKVAPVNEAARAEAMTRFGRGFGLAGLNASEGAGVGMLILGVVTAPVVGPILAVYRLVRSVKLRRYIAGVD